MGRTAHRWLVVLIALQACAVSACGSDDAAPPVSGTGGGATVSAGVGAGDAASVGVGGAGGAGQGGADPLSLVPGLLQTPPCPPDMAHVALVEGAPGWCMDRYEAPNVAGELPLVMESALSAEQWCADVGKRLCTEDEWVATCAGASELTYPYGDTHEAGRCNDDKSWMVVDESALATWPSAQAQAEVDALYQGAPSGSYEGCVGDATVYDLTGNVEEWVVRSQPHANNYPHLLIGCYWAGCYGGSKPTCGSTNPAHDDGFRYYETGFRCCADALVDGS